MGESAVEEKLRPLMIHAQNPTIATYIREGEVYLRVTAGADSRDAAQKLIEPAIQAIRAEMGRLVYDVDSLGINYTVARLLRERGLRLALAESCTGGKIAALITDVPGSSEIFDCGVVSYSNQVKNLLLGVREQTLEAHGAVSKNTAFEMANGIRNLSGSDLGLGVTGIAGPSGGSDEKPVGLVYIALADGQSTWIKELRLGTHRDRAAVRNQSAVTALDMVRRYLEQRREKERK
jgi:nicotinamide-nucleotide amidase